MKRKVLFVGLTLLAAVLFVLAGTPRGEKQIREWLVGAPQDMRPAFSFSGSLDFSGETPVISVSGKETELDWEGRMAWAKTQISTTVTVAFDMVIWSPAGAEPPLLTLMHVQVGGAIWYIEYIGSEVHDGQPTWKFRLCAQAGVASIGLPPLDEDCKFVWLPKDGNYYSYSAAGTIVPVILKSAVTESPIAPTTGVTHAKEVECEDQWFDSGNQNIAATLNGLSAAAVWPSVNPATLGMHFEQAQFLARAADGANDCWQFANIVFNGVSLNCSKLDEYIDPDATGPSWTGEKLHMIGDGNTIRGTFDAAPQSSWFHWIGTSGVPLSYAFSGLSVVDMDGNLLGDLEVWCTGVRELDGGGNDIGPVKKTVNEWRAYSITQSTGLASWESDDPDLLPAVAFYVDRDSARTHRLEGFQG